MYFGSIGVAFALFAYHGVTYTPETPACDEPVVEVRKTLPEICAPFYNDGTGRWAECMGVGPKAAPDRQEDSDDV